MTFAAATVGHDLYDCSACYAGRSPRFREQWGCRRERADALSEVPINAMGLVADHCPGVEVSSGAVASVVEIVEARDAGFVLGDLMSAPAPLADCITHYSRARDAARRLQADG